MNTATHSIRLLLVDDMPQVRKDLGMILLLAGTDSRPELEIAGEAVNGWEAVTKTMELQPDVVLMDLKMPIMDGFAAASEIKRIEPSTRVIALTVYGDTDSRERAKLSGFDAFVEKGTPVIEMIRVIKSEF